MHSDGGGVHYFGELVFFERKNISAFQKAITGGN
jgi:hypothetical protein